jgi:hypothetical protein
MVRCGWRCCIRTGAGVGWTLVGRAGAGWTPDEAHLRICGWGAAAYPGVRTHTVRRTPGRQILRWAKQNFAIHLGSCLLLFFRSRLQLKSSVQTMHCRCSPDSPALLYPRLPRAFVSRLRLCSRKTPGCSSLNVTTRNEVNQRPS